MLEHIYPIKVSPGAFSEAFFFCLIVSLIEENLHNWTKWEKKGKMMA